MRRRTPLRSMRPTPRKSGRVLWPEYLDAVRAMPCYVCGKAAPSDPDHMGPRPFGRKADDDTAVPMCKFIWGCHRMRTDGHLPDEGADWKDGPTKLVTKEEMRAWCDKAIQATQAVVLPLLASRGIPNPKDEKGTP